MVTDKDIETLGDAEAENISDCCSAKVYNGLCYECKEPCNEVSDE